MHEIDRFRPATPPGPRARTALSGLSLFALATLSACAVGPDYQRPTVATPPAFKEAQGWSPAVPADGQDKGPWWAAFDDPVLDGLERQVEVSNQTLAAAEAAYREARALVAEDRAQLFPTIGLSGAAAANHGAGSTSTATTTTAAVTSIGGNSTRHEYQVGVEASWVPDLWGKIRREIEGAQATAQASAADLANARLVAQSELAQDYIQLRMTDAEKDLFVRTVATYQRALTVTQNAGRTPRSSVLTASTTLHTAEANLVDLDKQRTQAEHAIAVLMGKPPAEFSLAPQPGWSPVPPEIPLQLPSTLLQRRPDIAAAERNAAEANAQIGVATAAYYPDLSLTASYGVESAAIHTLFRSSNTLWSLGADVAETVIDFGARAAAVEQSRAAFDASVATYRQTVLSAFQGVEDALAAASVLQREQPLIAAAVSDSSANVEITLNEFKAGTVDYTTVATAQAAALTAQQSALSLQAERMTEAVDLIEALGGGWSADQLASK